MLDSFGFCVEYRLNGDEGERYEHNQQAIAKVHMKDNFMHRNTRGASVQELVGF